MVLANPLLHLHFNQHISKNAAMISIQTPPTCLCVVCISKRESECRAARKKERGGEEECVTKNGRGRSED